ncbi:MAG: hemerythrin domain-containing protein [Pseudomonadota bacterium]
MPQTIWLPEMMTGVVVMDALHRDFLHALAGLSVTADKDFGAGYGTLVTSLERAFATEEMWMEQIAFPALKSHREQHARVLSALHHAHPQVMQGDLSVAQNIVKKLLPQWFAFHVATMDTTLAIAMEITCRQATHRTRTHAEAYAD